MRVKTVKNKRGINYYNVKYYENKTIIQLDKHDLTFTSNQYNAITLSNELILNINGFTQIFSDINTFIDEKYDNSLSDYEIENEVHKPLLEFAKLDKMINTEANKQRVSATEKTENINNSFNDIDINSFGSIGSHLDFSLLNNTSVNSEVKNDMIIETKDKDRKMELNLDDLLKDMENDGIELGKKKSSKYGKDLEEIKELLFQYVEINKNCAIADLSKLASYTLVKKGVINKKDMFTEKETSFKDKDGDNIKLNKYAVSGEMIRKLFKNNDKESLLPAVNKRK